jgi:hypothetical protein
MLLHLAAEACDNSTAQVGRYLNSIYCIVERAEQAVECLGEPTGPRAPPMRKAIHQFIEGLPLSITQAGAAVVVREIDRPTPLVAWCL